MQDAIGASTPKSGAENLRQSQKQRNDKGLVDSYRRVDAVSVLHCAVYPTDSPTLCCIISILGLPEQEGQIFTLSNLISIFVHRSQSFHRHNQDKSSHISNVCQVAFQVFTQLGNPRREVQLPVPDKPGLIDHTISLFTSPNRWSLSSFP